MMLLGYLLLFIALLIGSACFYVLLLPREESAEIIAPEQPEPYEPVTCKHPWRTERCK
jgi:hypothetical protein